MIIFIYYTTIISNLQYINRIFRQVLRPHNILCQAVIYLRYNTIYGVYPIDKIPHFVV